MWLQALGAPAARSLLAWQQSQCDALLADVFGYHALQVGHAPLQALAANRMPHRWLAGTEYSLAGAGDQLPADLTMDTRAWPLAAESLDLVVLPHVLEACSDPHACLREVERVLIPEGQVLILGLKPWSRWGWRARQQWQAERRLMPDAALGQGPMQLGRLRDWLRLLNLEVQRVRLYPSGPAWWPMQRGVSLWGGAYLVLASKHVPGLKTFHPAKSWRTRTAPGLAPAGPARGRASGKHQHPGL